MIEKSISNTICRLDTPVETTFQDVSFILDFLVRHTKMASPFTAQAKFPDFF